MPPVKVKVGNYRAPVDMEGLDPEMAATLNPKRVTPAPAPENPIQKAVRKASEFMQGHMNSTGSRRSPSTIRDARPVRSDAQVAADYAKEKASRAGRKP
jgi:hypothetical protein